MVLIEITNTLGKVYIYLYIYIYIYIYNIHIYLYIYIYNIYVYYMYISGDNTDQNGDCRLILGAEVGLKPKILLSYLLGTKNYS